MSGRPSPRVLSVPAGAPFLPALAEALVSGRLVPGFCAGGDPLALSGVTIYVPTRRAARELRRVFVEQGGGGAAILPTIRPLGEFDEDEALFDPGGGEALALAPPVGALDRVLLLAPVVRAWKRRLPAHVAKLFQEEVTVPASSADSIWLARDLAQLIDEVETEGADWTRLAELVPDELAGWWQVTLDFLKIATEFSPRRLAELGLSSPAAHRNALIAAETARLAAHPPAGPVIAAGSTGSIPATAGLLAAIAALPHGAVVLPGLDKALDEPSWKLLTDPAAEPSVLGHPQYGLAKLLARVGVARGEVGEIGDLAPEHAGRMAVLGAALRPAETTDAWADGPGADPDALAAAFAGVTLVEAANERDEALAIAVALRLAVEEKSGGRAALVTGDRALARRVSAELLRFGIRADDSGGAPLASSPPATLIRLMLEAAFRPGDPLAILALLKHPLLRLGLPRPTVRHAAEAAELVALRGGTGRPDLATLPEEFPLRFAELAGDARAPGWLARLDGKRFDTAQDVICRLRDATATLFALRQAGDVALGDAARATVRCAEDLARDERGSVEHLYAGDAGARMAEFLRGLVAPAAPFEFDGSEWPDVFEALVAPETVKPSAGAERRVAIWGALEARLQTVDMLVVGGLNEGVWPRRPEADRFMSRLMKGGLSLEPPERRIGQSAHDFVMAMGAEKVVLARSVRSDNAPAVPSRWLQRLATVLGPEQSETLRARGEKLLRWSRALDAAEPVRFAVRPRPTPPVDARPKRFSVTEIETLRRDPYAVYARRVLGLAPLEPLLRDPGAAERGTLFHEILHRFSASGVDARTPAAFDALVEAGRLAFGEAALPDDVRAVWWPRFMATAGGIVAWEAARSGKVLARRAEERASALPVGASGATLSGRPDRIDLLAAGHADIIDYKTGSSPTKAQAHTLLSPQLALEAALLRRGAFRDIGRKEPADLVFVRLKADGSVVEESILELRNVPRSAPELAEDAWRRLESLLSHYNDPATGYLSRALPYREGETDGDYDHLARVLEWSAGGDGGPEADAE